MKEEMAIDQSGKLISHGDWSDNFPTMEDLYKLKNYLFVAAQEYENLWNSLISDSSIESAKNALMDEYDSGLNKIFMRILESHGISSFIKDDILCVELGNGDVISIAERPDIETNRFEDIIFLKIPAYQKGYKRRKL